MRVHVWPSSSGDAGPYDLTVSGIGAGSSCTSDLFSPNYSCASSASLADGTYDLTVCKTEPDYFSFTVADGATFTADALFSDLTADVDMMLWDAAACDDNQSSACGGTLDCGFTGSDNEQVTWTNSTGADADLKMRVHVYPSSSGDSNTYTLVVTGTGAGTGCTADAFSPNYSCGAAATLDNGSYSLEVCKIEPDFFSFTVAAGATWDGAILHSTSNADIDAMLYEAVNCSDDQGSACGSTLACGYSGSDDEILSWTNTTGADVDCILRVHVWPGSTGDDGPYDLIVSGIGGGGGAVVFEEHSELSFEQR